MTQPAVNLTPAARRSDEILDPGSLMRIKALELRAKIVVQGFMHGLHRSPYHGFSVEFSEYRQYSPGDDPRYLDWKLYARSDRHYIKRFEDETNLRCHLAVDSSRSMSYGSLGYTKADYAATLAGTLAYFLSLQHDAVGLVRFDERLDDILPPHYRPGQLRRLMLALERPSAGRGTDVAEPLRQFAEYVSRRGIVVILSDCLAELDGLETALGTLRSRGQDVILFQILDPAETSFDFEESLLFEDLETGRDLYVDPQQVRPGYLEKLEAHNQSVRATCDKLGIEYFPLTTNQPLDGALHDFLQARMRRGRRVSRRGV
ncbi:VWA domain containing CoxE-like protein [Symmachiella dynata]|uniref:VWA domain containing CoxE-like protein n=1 Tax=Symmachiella dynata TaxID=2527995 RepID=A0A517ZH44_9PLAN|nr:DUF58 domain-containing protein [Symmachiella dynata]QDU41781.1 VWA domain containing CoxE-like protein [Symmachiella dynata]